jgi:hypothetical protein
MIISLKPPFADICRGSGSNPHQNPRKSIVSPRSPRLSGGSPEGNCGPCVSAHSEPRRWCPGSTSSDAKQGWDGMGAGYGSPRNPWGPLGPVQISRALGPLGAVDASETTQTLIRCSAKQMLASRASWNSCVSYDSESNGYSCNWILKNGTADARNWALQVTKVSL